MNNCPMDNEKFKITHFHFTFPYNLHISFISLSPFLHILRYRVNDYNFTLPFSSTYKQTPIPQPQPDKALQLYTP